jgi:O-antigen biosynthesis protein
MHKKRKLLIIGYVWPEPNSSAAGSRMLQLILLFKEWGWDIAFASCAADSEFAVNLAEIGVSKHAIQLNHSSFDAFVKELDPQLMLFDRFLMEEQFGWRVAEVCPDAIRLLDTEDLHSLRNARQMAYKKNGELSKTDLYADMAKREVASILRCDCSLIISEFEMDLLVQTYGINPSILLYYPILFNEASLVQTETLPSFEERSNFMFMGNFLHEPNWAAVKYLKEIIWPIIRSKLPQAKLEIYGAYPSQKVEQLHQAKDGFHIMGRAEEALPIFKKARVCIAPILFGAGLKGKLLDAMVSGTPTITTTMGAEGINGTLPWSGFIEDDAIIFAEKAIKLYTNKTRWQTAQINGFSILQTRFQKARFEPILLAKITQLEANLPNHRNTNFIGSILHHQTLLSTKYMSKWIEGKSKEN